MEGKNFKTNSKRRKYMDFEKAYEKFLNGTATPEEIEFVRAEMKKANDINGILANVKSEGATNGAEREDVKRAIKSFWKKDVLKTLLIVGCSILVLAIGVSLAVGIPILNSAKDNLNYTAREAREIAVQYIADRYPDGAEKIKVHKTEKELEVEGRIKNARYIYVVEVYNGVDEIVEIEIDGKTGNIIDVD